MKHNPRAWLQHQIDATIAILRTTLPGGIESALPRIAAATGRVVTTDVLLSLFRRLGLGRPSDYCIGGSRNVRDSRTTTSAYMAPEHVHDHVAVDVDLSGLDEPRGLPALDYDDLVDTEPQVRSTMPAAAPAAPMVELPRTSDEMLEERAEERERRRLKAERDALLEQLNESNARSRFLTSISAPVTPTIHRREPRSGVREGALVVLASDWHVEERVDPVSIAHINEYSLEIAERRAHRFFDGIEWLLAFERQAFAIRDVVLWLGGDLYSGHIHEENVETSELAPVESVLFLKRLLTQGIKQLLADPLIERLVIPCSYGNHGRTTHKRRVSTGAQNSFEWLLYQVLKDDFAHEPRVTFSADKSSHQYVEVFEKTLHFTHGDELKYAGGIGGLSIPLGRRIPHWDRTRPALLHHIGHFHTFSDVFGRAITNGSLIGFNAYAQSIGASPEPPQQAAYVLDSRKGKCLVTPIWVGEEAQEREAA